MPRVLHFAFHLHVVIMYIFSYRQESITHDQKHGIFSIPIYYSKDSRLDPTFTMLYPFWFIVLEKMETKQKTFM